MLVNAPIAVENLHGPDKNVGHRHGSIIALLDAANGGIGGFNELNSKDKSFLTAEAKKRGLAVRSAGLNGMVFDPTKFSVGQPRIRKIMQGGHVGADGTSAGPDNRRVGPNRYGLYWPVTVLALDFTFEFVVTHTMARAFTLHKWRQPLFWKSIRSLADGVLDEDGVMMGDFNTNQVVDLPGVADVNVPAPPDMGKQHYTKMMRWGKRIFISALKAVNTPSDHHMLKGTITLYREPQGHLTAPPASHVPTPKPSTLPQPGTRGVRWKKYGAPVAHPWASKYKRPRFKKRRPVLAGKIARWKAAYRRRL